MPMGENRILLIRMEGTNRNAQIAALPVTDLRNTSPASDASRSYTSNA